MYAYPSRKSKQKGVKHLFEILSQIKDCILKKRYNLAWELASKHYQQNRNSLTNQQIYQLCWQSCIAIEKKIYHRLTAKNKRNIAPVANSHIQHVLSLQLSLHAILLPQIVCQDKPYFNMLYNQSEALDPKSLSEQQLIFERKNQTNFLPQESTPKEIKKLVKQHLKICNSILMYKIGRKKSIQDIKDIVAIIQSIFDGVKEHQFPEQVMDFELIKLTLIQEFGKKDQIQCHYRLPLGFLNKIYQRLTKRTEQYLDHYLRKLNSYLALSFRNLPVTIEDVYIGCSEAKFIAKIAHTVCLPSSKNILHTRKKAGKSMQRMITLDNDNIQQSLSRFSKMNSQVSEANTTQKKIDSKKKVTNKGQTKLRQCAQRGLKVIEDHIQGRRQISDIILKYYNFLEIKKKQDNNSFKEEFIENAVKLNEEVRNRKKGNEYNEEQHQFRSHSQKNKDNLLTSLLARPKNKAKSSPFDSEDNQPALLRIPTNSKSKAKFILKNIQMVKQPQRTHHQLDKLNRFVDNIESEQRLHNLYYDYSDDSEDYEFEKQRKKKIEEYKLKLACKNKRIKNICRNQRPNSKDLTSTEYSCNNPNDETRSIKICLLDEVVNTAINQRLLGISKNIPPLKKLQSLKFSVQSLNSQRKMLVQSLSIRQNESDKFIKQNIKSFSHYAESSKQGEKEQIDLIVDAFKKRVNEHVINTRKLVNLNKVKDSFLPKKPQAQNRLRIDPKKRNRRLSELTFQKIEDAYQSIKGTLENGQADNEMALRYQFDQLRRDVAKNQFMTQTQKKNSIQKRQSLLPNIPTIVEMTREEDTLRG